MVDNKAMNIPEVPEFSEIRESFFAMLQKAEIDSKFWSILFESFSSLFRLEFPSQIRISKTIIQSSDKSAFNVSTGTLRIGRKRAFWGVIKSLLVFLALFTLAILPKNKTKKRKYALLFGFEQQHLRSKQSVNILVNNLRKSLPMLFNKEYEYIFENRSKLGKVLLSKTSTHPMLSLYIFKNHFGAKSQMFIVFSLLKTFLKVGIKNLELLLLAPERVFLEFPLWEAMLGELDFRLICTQSKATLLPVPFFLQRYDRSMVWYSNNSLPINRRGHEFNTPKTAVNLDFIDKHYVWSDSHKDFLVLRYPKSEIIPVGPIIFESHKVYNTKPLNPRGVLYFDVTPFENLDYDTFYTSEMCRRGVSDLAEVCDMLGLRFHLKQKRKEIRSHRKGIKHSRDYLELLDYLESSRLMVRLDPRASITELVMNYKVVIGLPFTSPVLISSYLNRPSVYYVPGEIDDWDIQSERDNISVIKGRTQLLYFLSNFLNK